MDYTQVSAPRTASLHNFHCDYDGQRQSRNNMSGHPFTSRGPIPMPIPSKSPVGFAPPPLPPPTRISDLENGHDVGWIHANSNSPFFASKLAPINPTSSLFGGHHRPQLPWGNRKAFDELDSRQGAPLDYHNIETNVKIELPPQGEEVCKTSGVNLKGTE